MLMKETSHKPVLLEETLAGVKLTSGNVAVDATFGGGGHTLAMLEAVGESGLVIGIDRDQQALDRFQEHQGERANLRLVQGNYSELGSILARLHVERVDAIIADLGFSSDQIEDPARGLAFSKEGPLDMRFDQSSGVTAKEVLATATEAELRQMLSEYGEEPDAKKISHAIVLRRAEKAFETTGELAEFLKALLPRRARSDIHPATKTFQALRIAVNQEKEHLLRFLESTVDALKPGGRLAVITFHSGEDRVVKHFFKEASRDCICPKEFPICRCDHRATLALITGKPIVPSMSERETNPRARSAKLRIAEKVGSKDLPK